MFMPKGPAGKRVINWQSNYTGNCVADSNPPQINSQTKYGATIGDKNCAIEDAQDGKDALTQINDPALGFLFAYFTFADDWSHQYMEDIMCTPVNKALQFDPECSLSKPFISSNFINAARVDLDQAENIVNAIKNRQTYADEDWLIILTTDHGRNSFGGHGGETLPEKLPFIALNKTPNDELLNPHANQNMVDDLKKNLTYSADYELYQYKDLDGAAQQIDIAPSILAYLNIPIHNFNLDGTPFIGPTAVRKLYANNYNYDPLKPHACIDLSWIVSSTENINTSQFKIYRASQLLNPQPSITINSNIFSAQDCSLPLADPDTNYTVEFSPNGSFTDSIYTNTKLWSPVLTN